ncbi:hypothetical protein [Psychromonas ossibalaenae]|nr:hypothetical protein [Psychromonas ossibalaenae]
MLFIKKLWKCYCDWLDELGFSIEHKRSCVPLSERAQKAVKDVQSK